MFSQLAQRYVCTLGDSAFLWPYDDDRNWVNTLPAVVAWVRCVTAFDPAGPLLRRHFAPLRRSRPKVLGADVRGGNDPRRG